MRRDFRTCAVAAVLLTATAAAAPALAQKPGGVLRVYSLDSPASRAAKIKLLSEMADAVPV